MTLMNPRIQFSLAVALFLGACTSTSQSQQPFAYGTEAYLVDGQPGIIEAHLRDPLPLSEASLIDDAGQAFPAIEINRDRVLYQGPGTPAPGFGFGVMGGSMQAQGHTQVMVRFADYRQNPQAAADAPRWRVGDGLEVVNIEHGVPAAVLDELKSRGHKVVQADRWSTDFGRAQLIYRMDDGYLAASERRTDGQAVGF